MPEKVPLEAPEMSEGGIRYANGGSMSLDSDPQPLMVIEHRERLLREQLKQVMARSYDLLQDEGRIRNELQLLENRRVNLLGGH